ncbi:MAG: hypothetical protein QY332_18280 [Anaerolineales bacterium]|nr:MAG: hypothetical protein QY332_18280 [Anaerolineales bacterium]
METLRKSIAAFCALSFVFTAVASLFLFNFDRRAFTAETYQRAFARDDFYNKLPAVMAEAMTSSGADQSRFPSMVQGMDRDAWEAFFRTLLPPEMLQVMGNDALNSTFAYFNLQTDTVLLNLAPLKASLTSDRGVQAVFSLLGTLPTCDLLQIGQMTLDLFSGGQIEFCNPPADLQPMLIPVIQGQLQFTAAAIPDQLVIVSAPLQNDPRQRLKTARAYMRISPLLPVSFLLGILIFGVRSLRGWLNWWGIPLALTGVIAFVTALLGGPVFGGILQRLLLAQMPNYLPPILSDYAGDLASAMVQTLFSPVIWQGLALVLLGAGMQGAGYLLKKQK